MKRKCPWCGMSYDTRTSSSIWCTLNPRRGQGAKRLKLAKRSIVTIGVMVLKPNPWARRGR